MATKQYLIVAKAEASGNIRRGESLEVGIGGNDKIVFFTRYVDVGFEVPIPRGIMAEIFCSASNIKEAAAKSANKAQGLLGAIGLCANAYFGHIEIELVFENSPGITRRDYFQSFIPASPLEVIPGRMINLRATSEFITAVDRHPCRQRLMRAIAQYHEALRNWSLGNEVTCVEHIFIGVENQKIVALRRHLAETGLSEMKLAEEWGFYKKGRQKKKCQFFKKVRQTESEFLESEARRRLIFKEDRQCSKLARLVSDGFEHGYEEFGKLRSFASQVTQSSARYLRESILEHSGISKESFDHLASFFSTPRGPLKIVKYLWGFLTGGTDSLAAPGHKYPFCEWTSKISKVYVNEEGGYLFSPSENFRTVLGPGVMFNPERFEAWDGSTIREKTSPIGNDEPEAI